MSNLFYLQKNKYHFFRISNFYSYLKKYFFLHEVDAHANESHPEQNIKRAEDNLSVCFTGADVLVNIIDVIIARNYKVISSVFPLLILELSPKSPKPMVIKLTKQKYAPSRKAQSSQAENIAPPLRR